MPLGASSANREYMRSLRRATMTAANFRFVPGDPEDVVISAHVGTVAESMNDM